MTVISVELYLTEAEAMGQAVMTSLSLFLSHFREVRTWAQNQSLRLGKERWESFESKWISLNVSWPQEGAFDVGTIKNVEIDSWLGTGQPYIIIWESLVEEPFPWVKSFLLSQKQQSSVSTLATRE